MDRNPHPDNPSLSGHPAHAGHTGKRGDPPATASLAQRQSLEQEVQSLSLELASSYEELSLLYKLSNNLRVSSEPSRTIQSACEDLLEVVGLRWLCLSLNAGDERLRNLGQHRFTAGWPGDRVRTNAPAGAKPGNAGREAVRVQHTLADAAAVLQQRMADQREPMICDDVAVLGVPELEALTRSLLVLPIQAEGRLLGVMFGGDRLDHRLISTVDAKLCDALANSLAIFLENHMLYEETQQMFLGTLQALTAAIDAKDSYTRGHSNRVAMLARGLAAEAGFDARTCERVHLAGLVHDIGKIGVPEAVLAKPGRLTEAEFLTIKTHPQIGANIIGGIRQMRDLVPGVLCHHEAFNGAGYPHGIAGTEIPLFGRVIALADAFDAMSSRRTYRRALPHEDVMNEIARCSGTQFDPDLTDAFLGLDFTEYHQLIREHESAAIDRQAA